VGLGSLLFGFNGRISRGQYWLGCMGAGVGGTVIMFAVAMMFAPPPDLPKGEVGPNAALGALAMGLVMLAMSWSGFALQVKRFHDRGKSGFWALVPAVPVMMITMEVLGGVASNAPAGQVVPAILPWLGVLMLINLWFFVDLGLLPGTSGPNKYDHTPGAGGGTGRGMPLFGGAPQPSSAAAASIFGNAEQAIDRAVAEQARAAVRTEMAAARATGAGPAGFGRKPAG
jgi:uncharacterized membrane protein YhaH (DUF805 family)